MKKLHKDYIQKSRIFLYPSLDIRRGTLVKPVQTYVAWEETPPPRSRDTNARWGCGPCHRKSRRPGPDAAAWQAPAGQGCPGVPAEGKTP